MSAMMNPAMMTGMLKQSFMSQIYQVGLSFGLGYFFSGFIMAKLPFGLTQKFKVMLHQGFDIPLLDASFVSSMSLAFLFIYGLQGVYGLMFDSNPVGEDLKMMNPQYMMGGAGAPNQPKDYTKLFESERDNYNLMNYDFELDKAEDYLINKFKAGRLFEQHLIEFGYYQQAVLNQNNRVCQTAQKGTLYKRIIQSNQQILMAGRGRNEEPRFNREHERTFIDYLGTKAAQERLQTMLDEGKYRFAVNLDELRQVSPSLVQALLSSPTNYIEMMSECIKQVVDELEGQEPSMKGKAKSQRYPPEIVYDISFEGNFGRNHVTPRGLNAENIGQLMRVRGIVTRLSLVRAKMLNSVHYCEDCKQFHDWNYTDQYDIRSKKREKVVANPPTKDYKGHPLQMEFGLCQYKDYQDLVLQEMPERTPPGQLPRSVRVIMEKDLVDKAKPGDRIDIVGVYKALPQKARLHTGIFGTALLAVNLTHITEIENQSITELDIKRIQEISKKKDVFELLSGSIAASIEGHKYIKQALLLQLLGGVEKTLDSGTHLRGDINILLVGDPSTGKSQLLRSIMNLATLSISTTGRGSTGVGLTAAVVSDKETGERHLEAGAMVLGDRGIVCIDEFDKMSDLDRVAIHEVMEQQTVTIAKAGIYTSLNARCSVLAAANPIYGEYVTSIPLNRNIGLADSLLSRFDLLFITLDKKEPENDRQIAKRVILNHRYKGDNDMAVAGGYWVAEDNLIEPEAREEDGKETLVYEKHGGFLYGGRKSEIVTKSFLKKYIAYAKRRAQPKLSNDAVNYISKCWSAMRLKEQAEKTLPITVRTLETLIRLATAHAKCRISDEVTVKDCEVVEKLLNYAIFREDPEAVSLEPEPMEDDMAPKVKKAKVRSKHVEAKSKTLKDEDKTVAKRPEEEMEEMKDISKPKPIGSKKRKVDLEEEVKDVLNATLDEKVQATDKEKQFIYKLISGLSNKSQKSLTADIVWQHFQKLPKDEQAKVNIKKKSDLVHILRLLDHGGRVTYADDGNIAVIQPLAFGLFHSYPLYAHNTFLQQSNQQNYDSKNSPQISPFSSIVYNPCNPQHCSTSCLLQVSRVPLVILRKIPKLLGRNGLRVNIHYPINIFGAGRTRQGALVEYKPSRQCLHQFVNPQIWNKVQCVHIQRVDEGVIGP
eukprot:TRINITY_DN2109_c0_g1_i1.p1 TRINITY_DN2109_c0_g1~~TRINITY_DN2109_c0_g1_i1.p1  ORF type:complete len:1160 (-),score=115.81 TRINITY_DN2109_c0_g1_i1:6531-10010(-)